jgi:hypothetical protein
MRYRIALLSLVVLLTANAVFTQTCPDGQPVDCFVSLQTSAGLTRKNTGEPALTTATNSSLRDFLTLFTAAVSSSHLTETGTALTLDWNLPLRHAGDTLKLQSIFNQAALDSKLKTQLAGHSDADTIAGSLGDFDDIQLSVTWAPGRKSMGRRLAPHERLISSFVAAQPLEQTIALLKDLREVPGLPAGDFKMSDITDARVRALIEKRFTAAATEDESDLTQQSLRMTAFRELVSNQPQFYVSGVAHIRDRLVGADTYAAKMTYEIGGGTNLNSFYAMNDKCKTDYDAVCDGKFQSFAEEARKKTADAGGLAPTGFAAGRFAFALEYTRTNANNIVLPQDSIDLRTPRGHRTVGSIVWGTLLVANPQHEGRFDLNVAYEDNSADANLKDRLIASAIYTQKINDTVLLPIGIVYANHARYLTDVDRKLSVHFGLVYKLPTALR